MGWFSKKEKAPQKTWQEELAEEMEAKKKAYFEALKEGEGFDDELIVKMDTEDPWVGMSQKVLEYMYNDADSEEVKETENQKKVTLVYTRKNPKTSRKVSNKFVIEDGKVTSIDLKVKMKKIWEYRNFNFSK
jgi:hypothetical protein